MKPLMSVYLKVLRRSLFSKKRQAGNAIMAVLMAFSTLSLSYYFLTSRVVDYKKKVVGLTNDIDLRLTMQSALDYSIFGLKKQYCFNSIMLQDGSCDLKNNFSAQRLLMSENQLKSIKEMIENGVITEITLADLPGVPLMQFTRSVDFDSVAAGHPLFVIFSDPKIKKMATGMKFTFSRDTNQFVPKYGGEIYINVRVELYGLLGGIENKFSPDKFNLTSRLSMHPREIGSFALMMPYDLRLDKTTAAVVSTGNVHINQFSTAAYTGKGLTFLSPVFVNRNIHLPSTGNHYTPVTFASRVYLGNGRIHKNEVPYSPVTAGAEDDRYWNDNKENFGGFLNGVEVDGGFDKGLFVLAGIGAYAAVDDKLMQDCLELNNRRTNIDDMYNFNSASADTLNFGPRTSVSGVISTLNTRHRVSLNNSDEFYPQSDIDLDNSGWSGTNKGNFNRVSNAKRYVQQTYWCDNHERNETNWVKNSNYLGPVTTAFFEFKTPNRTATITADLGTYLGPDPEVKEYLELTVNHTTDFKNDVQSQVNAQTVVVNTALNTLNSEITLKNDLITTLATLPTSDPQHSVVTAQIVSKTAEINTVYQPDYNTEKAQLIALNSKLSQAVSMVANPAKIKVYFQNVLDMNNKVERNKYDFNLNVQNEKSLIDHKGEVFKLSVRLKNYNLAYPDQDKKAVRRDSNDNSIDITALTGWLNFNRDGSDLLVSPHNLVSNNNTYPTVTSGTVVNNDNSLAAQCEAARNASDSQSFGSAAYNYDFSPVSIKSWSFTDNLMKPGIPVPPPAPTFFWWTAVQAAAALPTAVATSIILDSTNALETNASFQVRSFLGNCIIKPSAKFVTGFFTCKNLTIQARTTPLRIIGTFIVTGMTIDPTALNSGITWSSIYHPQAAKELRKLAILKPHFITANVNGQCESTSFAARKDNPIWAPVPALADYMNRDSCNVISLRQKADPFRWTAVDPDCGIIEGKSNTTCKNQIVNYMLIEHSRGQ